MPSVLGIYDQPGPAAKVARRLKNRGYQKLEVYSPAAFHELLYAVHDKPSKVRWWTLIGGLLGVVTGYAMPIWMASDWPIMIGGKPFSSIPVYTIIGYALQWSRRPLSPRAAVKAAVAITIVLWFAYYSNRPHLWNLWTYLLLYSFLKSL